MPVNRSALKRERQNLVRRERNRIIRSKVRTAYNHLMEAIHAKKKSDVDKNFAVYMTVVDKAVKKNIYHTNKGARKKARMAKMINKTFSAKKSTPSKS